MLFKSKNSECQTSLSGGRILTGLFMHKPGTCGFICESAAVKHCAISHNLSVVILITLLCNKRRRQSITTQTSVHLCPSSKPIQMERGSILKKRDFKKFTHTKAYISIGYLWYWFCASGTVPFLDSLFCSHRAVICVILPIPRLLFYQRPPAVHELAYCLCRWTGRSCVKLP